MNPFLTPKMFLIAIAMVATSTILSSCKTTKQITGQLLTGRALAEELVATTHYRGDRLYEFHKMEYWFYGGGEGKLYTDHMTFSMIVTTKWWINDKEQFCLLIEHWKAPQMPCLFAAKDGGRLTFYAANSGREEFSMAADPTSSNVMGKPPEPDRFTDLESRLEMLKALYDKGLITGAEYDVKRKEILDKGI